MADTTSNEPAQVYSGLKALAFTDRLEALREKRLAAPVNIRIKPINRCNHDCWYCAYRASNLQLGQDIDLEDSIPRDKMMEIVDDIVAMGVKGVTFTGGGEPLLYKPLPDCVERLAAGGVKIGALTNGSNLKGRMAEVFARHATWIRVSIDGWSNESYAKLRNLGENAFDKIMGNLEAFSETGTSCVLGASVIIGEDNHSHVYDLCRSLKKVGVEHVKLAGVITSNDGAENNAYHRKLKPRITEEIERAKTLDDERFRVIDHYHELDERFARPYHICPTIQFTPVIGADCMVYTCQDKAYTKDGTLGSIRERSFREFWFSEENRKSAFAIDPTVDCPHNCASHRKNMVVTDFLGIDPDHLAFV